MTNLKNIISFIRVNTSVFTLIIIAIILCLSACHDNSGDIKQGFTVANLCFGLDGGDVSNTLLAADSWSISIPGDNTWVTVSPTSGQSSSQPINLIFNADVNNNPASRSQSIILRIGSETYQYTANQDGTLNKVCDF